MFSTGRKNRENFGQEIVLGNLSRKLMNVVRLGLIFLLGFILSFIVFLILNNSVILPQLKNMVQLFPNFIKKKEVLFVIVEQLGLIF